MATVQLPDEGRTISDTDGVAGHLASIGIDYERWNAARELSAEASADEILAAYAREVERLKARGGYVTADVISVTPSTPGLEEMLARFATEHTHDEDEVRFVIAGRGVFHIHPAEGPVTAIEVEAGDLIRVPAGTRHWFNLCADRTIRAIRLFQDVSGWTPRYTSSGLDARYEPVCLGAAYLPR